MAPFLQVQKNPRRMLSYFRFRFLLGLNVDFLNEIKSLMSNVPAYLITLNKIIPCIRTFVLGAFEEVEFLSWKKDDELIIRVVTKPSSIFHVDNDILLIHVYTQDDGHLEILHEGWSASSHSRVLESISNRLNTLTSTPQGSRLIQKVLDRINVWDSEFINKLMALVKDHFVFFCTCMHANHVLRKIVDIFPMQDIKFMIPLLSVKVKFLSHHKIGSRIIEAAIKYFPCELLASLPNGIIDNVDTLLWHPYGNYVLQSVIEHCAIMEYLLDRIEESILRFGIVNVAKHHTANRVLIRLIEARLSRELKVALLRDSPRWAHSKYGSFVNRALRRKR